ncbi:hypothetical protein PSTG_02395 [Puccinia striiformis f. sp. tritici PST-78]|uniref:Vacuolar protein sorting-associated protein 51 homolog n=1 Tax=Puccinia striiformis f. sp. tritici PST-78 TaxID=1165861 RepID=A0A0L0VYX4_9BASI|nr:hypothetical protein PSTG_02395 [Puccinia striiformis f. sp. tritici PST-78]
MEDSQQPPRIGKLGSTGDPILAKQRARNLLHNYYGPEGGSGGNHEPLSPSRSEFPTIHHHQEKLSIDSPYFDVDSYLNQLVGNSSLKSLLSTANELMSEIRDLNCQCFYNDDHKLVEASETIDKMKSSSQKLDGTLSQLQDSLPVISQLSISLTKPTPSSRTRTSPKDKEREEEGRKTCNSNKFEDRLHLSALLSIPIILKGLLIDNKHSAKGNVDSRGARSIFCSARTVAPPGRRDGFPMAWMSSDAPEPSRRPGAHPGHRNRIPMALELIQAIRMASQWLWSSSRPSELHPNGLEANIQTKKRRQHSSNQIESNSNTRINSIRSAMPSPQRLVYSLQRLVRQVVEGVLPVV